MSITPNKTPNKTPQNIDELSKLFIQTINNNNNINNINTNELTDVNSFLINTLNVNLKNSLKVQVIADENGDKVVHTEYRNSENINKRVDNTLKQLIKGNPGNVAKLEIKTYT